MKELFSHKVQGLGLWALTFFGVGVIVWASFYIGAWHTCEVKSDGVLLSDLRCVLPKNVDLCKDGGAIRPKKTPVFTLAPEASSMVYFPSANRGLHTDLETLKRSPISNISDSMYPTITHGDVLLLKGVGPQDFVVPGRVYVYAKHGNTSHRIVHRFVGCKDMTCDTMIFKGDANRQGDYWDVKRAHVMQEVVGVLYG